MELRVRSVKVVAVVVEDAWMLRDLFTYRKFVMSLPVLLLALPKEIQSAGCRFGKMWANRMSSSGRERRERLR